MGMTPEEQQGLQDEVERKAAVDRFRTKLDAYRHLFGAPEQRNPHAQAVLDDLSVFCKYGDETISIDRTGRVDPHMTIYRDGKRAVMDRIQKMIEEALAGHGNRI